MVILPPSRPARKRGSLIPELLVAIALLMIAVLPLGYSIALENRLARAYYERAIAMEIVDGEMEVLLAGGWRSFAAGTNDYSVSAFAATNLSAGKFQLTLRPGHARLEWRPAAKHHGGIVAREAFIK